MPTRRTMRLPAPRRWLPDMVSVPPLRRRRRASSIDASAVVNALADAVFVLDAEKRLCFVNQAAEQLFGAGAAVLIGESLDTLIPTDNPLFLLISQVELTGSTVSETGVRLESPRIGSHQVSVRAAPLSDSPSSIVVTLHERSIAEQIDRQLTHRNAARSVTAMASMLAHEVKNPLSGIRGAAQLLEDGVTVEERELTRLICDEADRIVALVNRMEIFSDERPLARAPVNIHEVLDHVLKIARSGFARDIRIYREYDPSLPLVWGNRDQLVQVFLNLVKNAAEAVPEIGGEISLVTRYRHGLRLAIPGSSNRVELPMEIIVRDNGAGVPEDLRQHLFDPFVTTKQNGTGLGLALVAKIVGDHGGIIDVNSEPGRTEFHTMLPMYRETEHGR
jgi:two-component system nitrogen regulation sensor histidine kinase GlnL